MTEDGKEKAQNTYYQNYDGPRYEDASSKTVVLNPYTLQSWALSADTRKRDGLGTGDMKHAQL